MAYSQCAKKTQQFYYYCTLWYLISNNEVKALSQVEKHS